ncbi:MAG: 50S ribosomal protein L20 [Alphaproteobacteria bacterium]
MARIKRGLTRHARHKKTLDRAQGYIGRNKNVFRVSVQKVEKGLKYAYRDRKNNKRNFRSLWIQRINAGVRLYGLTYSKFVNGLNKLGLEFDRKVLASLAMHEPESFAKIVEKVKAAL